MSQVEQRQRKNTPDVDTGDLLMTEGRPRSVQTMGGNSNSLYANIPVSATQIHDIGLADNVRVHVMTNGIFIEPIDE